MPGNIRMLFPHALLGQNLAFSMLNFIKMDQNPPEIIRNHTRVFIT